MDNLQQFGAVLTAGRKPGQELSQYVRAAILGAVVAGASQTAVTKAFGIDRRTVRITIQRFKSSTNFRTRPRTGRLEKLTAREKRYIIQLTKHFPRISMQCKSLPDRSISELVSRPYAGSFASIIFANSV